MTWILIDRTSGTPLFRQIYAHFRRAILQGEMKSGTLLPSTRELASTLRISRNVIVEAYEQLFAEGYIESRHGSGTYVADGTFLNLAPREPSSLPHESNTRSAGTEQTDLIDFRHGIPALNLFPRKLWGRLAQRICADTSDEAFGYGKPEGRSELRNVLVRYLYRTRGVVCEPDQLIITTGATQAINLIAKLLLPKGNGVIVEDPITKEIHTMFYFPETALYPVPVDDQGMMTHLLPPDGKPSFIYVTPSHQFPIGGVLPIQRRVQLIQYAAAAGCYIVEDDYDSEFRYESSPVSSLQGLDPERVIYIGTFSKILSPALRMGYLILPRSLIETGRNLKWLTDLHTPSMEQLILARFIEEGHLDRHVAKMKKTYRKRRDRLIQSLNETFAGKVAVLGQSTGLHLVAEFTDTDFTPALTADIERHGIRVHPVGVHAIDQVKHRNRIILGYANLSEERIAEGIRRLGTVLNAKVPI